MTSKAKINITVLFIIFVSIVSFVFFIIISQATSLNGKYARSLDRIGYPNHPASLAFPSEIPEDAQDANYNYMSPLGQGGEVLYLTYTTTAEHIASKKRWLSQYAVFTGSVSENNPEETGISKNQLTYLEDERGAVPDDVQLYLLYSKPYKSGDWNHGEVSFVAISELQQQILVYFEDW